jgi:hypothetical protein
MQSIKFNNNSFFLQERNTTKSSPYQIELLNQPAAEIVRESIGGQIVVGHHCEDGGDQRSPALSSVDFSHKIHFPDGDQFLRHHGG